MEYAIFRRKTQKNWGEGLAPFQALPLLVRQPENKTTPTSASRSKNPGYAYVTGDSFYTVTDWMVTYGTQRS